MSDAIDISAVAMEVILNTGDGRTCIDQALDSLAEFDFDAAEEHLAQADAKILTAHKVQTATIQAQAAGEEVEYSLLFTHAQDTLMTTMILEKQARFTIDAYKRIAELEAKLA